MGLAAHITPESEILYTQDEYIDLYADAVSADGGEGDLASSCPSSWLKEVEREGYSEACCLPMVHWQLG